MSSTGSSSNRASRIPVAAAGQLNTSGASMNTIAVHTITSPTLSPSRIPSNNAHTHKLFHDIL